jgi:lipopolysaccharide export LptBFGC system permease protein LptF
MKDLHMKISQDTYLILIQKENYSQWIRDAIDEKLEKETNPEVINAKIQDLKQQIQQLQDLKKAKKDNGQKINEILNFTWETFNRNDRAMLPDHQNINWIKSRILPNLKEIGCTQYKAQDILEILKKRHATKRRIQ